MYARPDRRHLICNRPGCYERLATLDEQVWDPDGARTWIRGARLYGSGWHRRADGVWQLEAHARERVRRGKQPAASHDRGGAVAEIDGPVGGWPYVLGLEDELSSLKPDATRHVFRGGGGSDALRPGALIECGRCGSRNKISVESLAPTPEAKARLRRAGLLG